jgi:hypothetical protein
MGDYSKGYIIESGDDENNQLSNKLQTTNMMTKPSQSISKPSQPSQFSSNNSSQTELEEFKRYYIPYNGYNATDTCNPVTARLIIFYNDKLVPFLKKYYVQSTQRPESPTNYSITQVFIFFFQLIFYQNFYKYNDNEKTWLANQVSMIENNIIKNFDTLNLFKEGTKFADVLDFINKNNKNETNPVNNYIYTTVNELFSDQSLSDPIKKLFLNFMEIIHKYYVGYYSQWFYDFYYYFNGMNQKTFLARTENISTISVNMNEYLKPFIDNATNRRLIEDIIKNIQDQDLEKMLEEKYPEISIFIINTDYTHYFENRNTWDEIFESNKDYTNIDLLDTENAIASGDVGSQPATTAPAPAPAQTTIQQQEQPKTLDDVFSDWKNFGKKELRVVQPETRAPAPAPAPVQPVEPQPANDNFTPGEIVYGKADDGSWVQVRITSVDNSARNANLEVVANTNLKPTNIPFDRLSKTDPSYPSNSMGGKLTFSNKMKNRTKSLKVFKKKNIKRQNRSLKKLV